MLNGSRVYETGFAYGILKALSRVETKTAIICPQSQCFNYQRQNRRGGDWHGLLIKWPPLSKMLIRLGARLEIDSDSVEHLTIRWSPGDVFHFQKAVEWNPELCVRSTPHTPNTGRVEEARQLCAFFRNYSQSPTASLIISHWTRRWSRFLFIKVVSRCRQPVTNICYGAGRLNP